MERKELREKVIDLLHWKQYRFIGQDNMIFEGSLTQDSEEVIANQILALIEEIQSAAHAVGFRDGVIKGREGYVKLADTPSKDTIEDGFGSVWSAWCPECGKRTMNVVRPGQVQCSNCGQSSGR